MSEMTDRHALPLLIPGQGQKDITHNEALVALDAVLHPAVESFSQSVPPAAPALGQCWIVAAGASGAWSGKAGQIAAWTSGGWRFFRPVEGMLLLHRASGQLHRFRAGQFEAVLPLAVAPATVALPAGGTVIDQEARAAVSALIARLQTLGLLA